MICLDAYQCAAVRVFSLSVRSGVLRRAQDERGFFRTFVVSLSNHMHVCAGNSKKAARASATRLDISQAKRLYYPAIVANAT